MLSITSEVAVVTGATRGLGYHIALDLAQHGTDVVIVFRQREDLAQRVQAEIEALGRRALVVQADVRSEADVKNMVARVIERFERIDILINNAGVSRDGMSWRLATTDWNTVIDTNLTGVFLCIKHVLQPMRSQHYGRILSISSLVGQVGVPGTAAYSASKSALFGLTRTVAREVASSGVSVNAIALGYFDEGLGQSLPHQTLTRLVGEIPIGRLGEPADLTRAVRFFCAREAGYITGQTLSVNGGLYM